MAELGCVLLGCVLGVSSWVVFNSLDRAAHHVTVFVTDEGFSPAQLTVTLGDVVRFENKSTRAVWPASDLHPTHEFYSEFDSKREVGPGQVWEFQFLKLGNWKFHDHLSPFHVGTVFVVANRVVSTPRESFQDCDTASNQTVACAQTHILYVLHQKGLPDAFSALSAAYDTVPGFPAQCHGLTHSLGASAYDLFERHERVELTLEASYCGYGFFHGFIERLIFTSGDMSKAREFCAHATQQLQRVTQKTETACYHGIGHGVADSAERAEQLSPEEFIAPALELCGQVGDTEHRRYLCSSGAFNSLAIAWGKNLILPSAFDLDPYALCAQQVSDYNKKACFEEMNSRVVGIHREDLQAALAYALQIPVPADRLIAVQNLLPAYLVSYPTLTPSLQLVKYCRLKDEVLATACMEGLVGGLIERGSPGQEYSEAVQLCQLPGLMAKERSSCFVAALSSVQFLYPSSVVMTVCQGLKEEFKIYCK